MDEEEHPSLWNKLYLAVISLILLALMVPYFTLGPVYSEISGIFTSQRPESNQLVFRDTTLVFEGNTTAYLATLYTENQELKAVETAACLQGRKEATTYFIEEIFHPTILRQEFNFVQLRSCPPETLVMLHTHPELHCQASATDLRTFERRKASQPDLLMLIMCAPNRYVIYS